MSEPSAAAVRATVERGDAEAIRDRWAGKAQLAVDKWNRACARNQRIWNGTATPEDHAEIEAWLAGDGPARIVSALEREAAKAARERSA